MVDEAVGFVRACTAYNLSAFPAISLPISLLSWPCPSHAHALNPRPNIVIVLADDIGFL